MRYNLKWNTTGVEIKITGIVTSNEINLLNGKIIGSPHFERIRYQLWDFSDVKVFENTPEDAVEVASLDRMASRWNPKCQIVLINTNIEFANYLDAYTKEISDIGWECSIFKTVEEGMASLNRLSLV
ncbi:hypothetical protein [Williamwhitmania taraxaci]|uniref:STAS domain-containing protein n=1 Tax=Williamwhitmania taraxaci TaxID=1640674 RepID=A0A1G6NDA4_9BACT|nr:hypothetical protein [Williamwhitmania taraxaci]SDC65810.1 hypothetical protein SAMN05216323_104220 [Williamwhitmania taraxaci]